MSDTTADDDGETDERRDEYGRTADRGVAPRPRPDAEGVAQRWTAN